MATKKATGSSSSSSSRRTSKASSAGKSTGGAARENTDAAADRIRELNERIIDSSKKAGNAYLDIYEKTLSSIAGYQEKVAEESQVDWVSTIANAQASFTRDLATAYTSAARSLLK